MIKITYQRPPFFEDEKIFEWEFKSPRAMIRWLKYTGMIMIRSIVEV